MSLPFGDTHPSAMSPVDTADFLFHEGHMSDLALDKRAVEVEIRALHAERLRMERENAALLDENRNLHRLALAAAAGLPDNPAMQAKVINELIADRLRLEAQVRALHVAADRANEAWETKHIFGFSLKESLHIPDLP